MRRSIILYATPLLALLVAVGTYRWRSRNPSHPQMVQDPPLQTALADVATVQPGRDTISDSADVVTGATPTPAVPGATTNWLQSVLGENGERAELSPEQIERWLASGRTNAADLLAARQAGGGVDYLRQALTNFPNDPRVLFASTSLRDAPEVQRERLDRFKAAAPDNALADYLSARDHLQHARPEQAVADLLAASAKTRFEDYTGDAMQTAEELYQQAGKSPLESKLLGTASALLPHLVHLKGLAGDMADLEKQYLAAGDTTSAVNLARMGLQLGEQLTTGDGSRCLINQLVGMAVQKVVLNPLDPGADYYILGKTTIAERLAEIDGRRATARQDAQFIEAWMPTASEAELSNYFDRLKMFGEASALAWLKERRGGG